MDIGRRVREVREDLGMQRTVLARRVGVAENTIYRIETGERTPSVGLLERIARELRTEPAELLREAVPLAPARQEVGQPKPREEERLMDRPEVRAWLTEQGHMSGEEFLSWAGEHESLEEIEDAIAELHAKRDELLAALRTSAVRKVLFPVPPGLSKDETRNWLLKPPGRWELQWEIRHEYLARELVLEDYSRQLFALGETEDYLVRVRDPKRHEQLLEEKRVAVAELAFA